MIDEDPPPDDSPPECSAGDGVTGTSASDPPPPASAPDETASPHDPGHGDEAEPPTGGEAIAAAAAPQPLTEGAFVRGTIVSADDDEAVVELPGGVRAKARKLDMADELGKIAATPGQVLDFVVTQLGDPVWLKRRPSRRKQAISRLSERHDKRETVDGRVTSAIKGGYEVRIDGVRAFCPASQMALRPSDVTDDVVGKTLPFLITKFDAGGRSIVVSRRKVLEREQKKSATETRSRITEGARLTGRVVSFQPYGAFVDLGGIQGLLHVSEMSHARVDGPEQVLALGADVEVVVLRHDPGFKKVSLSMKALTSDPWEPFASEAVVGRVYRGRVRQVTGFGAFVELAPGVDGLLPLSEVSSAPSGDAPEASLAGSEIDVQVADLDPRRRRVGLIRPPAGAQPGDVVRPPEIAAGARITGVVERLAPFGVFIRLAPGRTGLLHASESGTPPGTDLQTAFRIGSRTEVEILEVSEDGDRIRLTKRTPAQRAARAEAARPSAGMDDRGPAPQRGAPYGERRPREERHGGGGGDRDRHERRPREGREDRRGGDRRGGERRGGPREVNPAAAPSRGFASLGDAWREQLRSRGLLDEEETAEEATPEASAESEAPADSKAPAESEPQATADEKRREPQPGEAGTGEQAP